MARDTHSLICIRCPRGCELEVVVEDGAVVEVTGHACGRGVRYAEDEVLHPMRMVTSSVPIVGSASAKMVSVRTKGDVPKSSVLDVIGALHGVKVQAPVHIGDVVVDNVCGTGVDVIATRDAV